MSITTTYCDWCGDAADTNHPRCEVALRSLALGYCVKCGEGDGELHYACVLVVAAEDRPSLLDPPSDEELAAWERFVRLVAEAVEERQQQLADIERRQRQAPWN